MLFIVATSWYVLMSVVTFVAYAWDKRQATLGKWRTRERTLHVLALLGGFPGAFFARRKMRHKNRKVWFTVILIGVVLLHAGAWIGWWCVWK